MPRRAQNAAGIDDEVEVISADDEEAQGFLKRIGRSFHRTSASGGTDNAPKQPKERQSRMPRGHPNETECAELVGLANLPIVMLSPRDAFTAWETQRLTEGLYNYAQTSDSARRWMYGIVQKSALLALINVGFTIALPRLIRHGFLPASIAPYIIGVCDAQQVADACGYYGSPNGTTPYNEQDYSRPADIPAVG